MSSSPSQMPAFTIKRSGSARNHVIDLMRFVAATAVVLYHYCFRTPDPATGLAFDYPALDAIFRYGYLGVDLFFAISGVVIFNSTRSATFASFWYGRFSRLYPAYWFCLGLTCVLLALGGHLVGRSAEPAMLLVNLTMLQKMVGVRDIDPVYWTLAYELVFYFWVSLAVALGRRDRVLHLLGVLTLIALLAYFLPLPGALHKLFLLDKIACFYAGAVIAEVHVVGMTRTRAGQLLLAVGVALLYGYGLAGEMSLDYRTVIDPVLVCVILAFIFAAVLCSGWIRVSAGLGRCFVALGALTYPLYLVHDVCGSIFSRAIRDWCPGYGNLFVTLAVAYLAAWLIARHVEEPAMRFLRNQPLRPRPANG